MKILNNGRQHLGFTLIELMIVVVVIAIIAAIAIPAYSDYVTRSRRADAKVALINFQLLQEKFRANNTTYSDGTSIGLPALSPDAYYQIAVSGAVSSSSYSLIATPQAPQVDSVCNIFVLTVNGATETKGINGGSATTPIDTCWQR